MHASNLAYARYEQLPLAVYPVADFRERGWVVRLRDFDLSEAFDFLSSSDVHAVIMSGLLRDNGLNPQLDRGTFYGYRGVDGELEGIALIGHSTIIEARSDEALEEFARTARNSTVPINLILSSDDVSERFFAYYSVGMFEPRKSCLELSFQTRFPFLVPKCDHVVRLAVPEELEPIARAQAELAFIESGVNPLSTDPEGFRKRVLRRIEKGRIYVVFEDGRLVFKADLITATPNTAYIEGVYVDPSVRGRGVGSSCLATVCFDLLQNSATVSLLSNVELEMAHACYAKAGFVRTGACKTLFL